MRGVMGSDEAAWSWLIIVAVIGLFAWGFAELLGLGPGTQATVAGAATAEAVPIGGGEPVIALHRLLPDATDDLGRLVRVDGIVLGEASPLGFWVRDLRDNIVFVAAGASGPPAGVQAGAAVRVIGRVALLSPGEQAEQLERAGLVVPANALVIRDIKVQPTLDGVEVLRD